jgi:hypothetical protein
VRLLYGFGDGLRPVEDGDGGVLALEEDEAFGLIFSSVESQ